MQNLLVDEERNWLKCRMFSNSIVKRRATEAIVSLFFSILTLLETIASRCLTEPTPKRGNVSFRN